MMEEAEILDAVLVAHERWARVARREIMEMLEKLGLPCETWEEAEEIALWLLGEVHDD